ncbi:hypothetical protein [Marinifilum caeruleilacunae]|uniref:ABC transporter permease n=1 Tax=Marinifilum caeruleilacunae TaxID=2499076 RepID=A0ABX1WR21_9BACT|nr:hypothetical protein [Marinifilum caeruleilacunae]NOU58456.1 hypothetical protein [Marinifilum caeruleilacunae]
MTTRNVILKVKFPKVSGIRLTVGIVMGLLYSFAFYSFMYMVREGFRLLSVTEEYDLWILSDEEVNFYNLFFAFVAVILSQSLCLSFWFDRPQKLAGSKKYRLNAIVNDQRVLNWYFLNWFAKLTLLFALMFGSVYQGGFYVFSFYPDYKFIFMLIVPVLFLHTWLTIRLKFKGNGWKWMLVSMCIVTGLSIGLSKINLIDYKVMNQSYLQKNIRYNYQFELAESDYSETFYPTYFTKKIYMVKSRSKKETAPLLIVDQEEIEMVQLHEKILDWQSTQEYYDIERIIFQLHIHKNIKVGDLQQLKQALAKLGARKIAYAYLPKTREYDSRYYRNFALQSRITDWETSWFPPKEVYKHMNRHENIIKVTQNSEGQCFINGNRVKLSMLKQNLKLLILSNTDYVIRYEVNDNIDFADYFSVISESRAVINELRNEYSKALYSKPFIDLYYEYQNDVKKKYPFSFFELTSDFQKRLHQE